MSKEVKALSGDAKAIAANIMAAFDAYKQANDQRLSEIEAKGASDPILDEKLRKLDHRIDTLSLKAARPADGADPVETREHDAAWSRYLRRGDESGLAMLDTKALSAGTDEQGGYVAPPELDRLIEARLMQTSPMRQIATVRQTSAGTYRKPVSLGVGAQWAGETDVRAQTSTTGLSLLEFPAGELYAMPAATQTLLEDAYADIDEWLADETEAAFSIQESAAIGPMIAVAAEPWGGPIAVRVGATEQTLRQKAMIAEPAGIGQTLSDFEAGVPEQWDETAELIVSVPAGDLSSADEASVLAGANRILIEHADGWELLAWRSAELVGADQWRLTGLLRGLNQTAARSGVAGLSVIIADERLGHVPLEAEQVGTALLWQVGTAASVSFTYQSSIYKSASDAG